MHTSIKSAGVFLAALPLLLTSCVASPNPDATATGSADVKPGVASPTGTPTSSESGTVSPEEKMGDESSEQQAVAETIMDFYEATVSPEVMTPLMGSSTDPDIDYPGGIVGDSEQWARELHDTYGEFYKISDHQVEDGEILDDVEALVPMAHFTATSLDAALKSDAIAFDLNRTEPVDLGEVFSDVDFNLDQSRIKIDRDANTASIDASEIQAVRDGETLFDAEITTDGRIPVANDYEGNPYNRSVLKLEKVGGTWYVVEDIVGDHIDDFSKMFGSQGESTIPEEVATPEINPSS